MYNNDVEPLFSFKKSERIQIYNQARIKGAITLYAISFERTVKGILVPLTPEQLSHLSYMAPHQKKKIILNKADPCSIGFGGIPRVDYVQEIAFSDLLVLVKDANQLLNDLIPKKLKNETTIPSGGERQKMWLKVAKEFPDLKSSIPDLAEAIFKRLQAIEPAFITKETGELIQVQTIKRFLYSHRSNPQNYNF